MSTGLVRQAAPVRVQLSFPYTMTPGTAWPISGITEKVVLFAAAGVWTGNVPVQVSSDKLTWTTVGVGGPNAPSISVTGEASWLRLYPQSVVSDAPTATLNGFSLWGEV